MTCETPMPDRESSCHPASPAQRAPSNGSGALSNGSAPPPERALLQARVGFVGLGRMGIARATNLAQSGCRVIGFVRRPERLKELSALGLDASVDIADLFDCSIVVSMLPDDRAVRAIVLGLDTPHAPDGLSSGLMPGAVHLSMSTISTAVASEMAAEH